MKDSIHLILMNNLKRVHVIYMLRNQAGTEIECSRNERENIVQPAKSLILGDAIGKHLMLIWTQTENLLVHINGLQQYFCNIVSIL